jgi:hypothetical protein
MAITITQTPQLNTPSDNPIVYAFKQQDDVSGADKFNVSFIVKVYLGGEIGTFEVFPELYDGSFYYGKIDVSDKVRAYVSNHSVSHPVGTTYKGWYDPSNWRECNIEVIEKYSLSASATPTVDLSTLTTSSLSYLFKASLSRKEFANWNYTAYQIGNNESYFLTDKPSEVIGSIRRYEETTKKEDTTILSWIEGLGTDYTVRVKFLNSSGATITSLTITIPLANHGAIGSYRLNMLELLDRGDIIQSTYDNCVAVEFFLSDSFGLTLNSARYTVTFSDVCFDKGANILWLNKYGSYDNFRFTYNSRYKAKIESKSFSKKQGEWNASTNTYNVNNNTFGKIDYLKTITKQLELSSDWLDETTQNWLVQLYESPLIYLNESTEMENVVVTDSSYQVKQFEHDELFNEVINIEFTDYKSISL